MKTILADWPADGWRRGLLVRRRVSEPAELTACVVLGWPTTSLAEVVRVAGSRWTIARSFEAAQGAVGLDHDDVRTWTGWYRHSTLAMWALALLTIMRAGTSAVEVFKTRLRPSQQASPLTALKARRGLASP